MSDAKQQRLRQTDFRALLAAAAVITAPVCAQEPAASPDLASAPAAVASPSPTSLAEDAAAGTAATAPKASRVIEEIIVTAQKREENLADVPISVQAFSGEKLEALGVKGPMDLPQITPGMQYNSLVGYSVVYLRGVGTDVFLPNSDPSVATYIDGIYFPFSHGLATDFGKLERVEVLKGPQGTLFGRNSTGGAINVVTAKPNPSMLEGALAYEVGSFDASNIKAYISGPLTDTLAVSFSLIDNTADSYYKRPADSQFTDFPRETTQGYNAKLNWEPSQALGMTLGALITRQTGLSSVVTSSFDIKPLGTVALVQPSPGQYTTNPDDDIHFRASSDVVYGEARWSPGPSNVKLLASRQNIITDTSFDFEGSSADLVNFHPKDQGATITTSELQWLSEEGGWLTEVFGRELQWITGLYYFDADKAGFRNLEVPVADGLLDLDFLNPLINDFADVTGLNLPSGADLRLTAWVNTTAYAVFAQGTYNLTDAIGLTIGARYQDEKRGLRNATTSVLNANATSTTLLRFADRDAKTQQFSPKLTLDYHFAEDSLVFASFQKGFKSGTFNIVSIYTAPTEVDPEKITNYEIGVKGRNEDGSFRYSAGIFQNDITNLQVLIISLASGGAVTIENAGEARVRGVDFDLLWQPLPDALPGLVLTGAGAYLDGEYLEYENGSGFDETTGLYFGTGSLTFQPGRDFAGNTTVRTPEYTFNFGPTYSFDAPGGNVEIGGSVYYNSGYYFSAQNKDGVDQPKYYLYNARISYLHAGSGIRLSVFGKNLADKFYWYNKFETDFNTIGTAAPPRTFGVRLDYQF